MLNRLSPSILLLFALLTGCQPQSHNPSANTKDAIDSIIGTMTLAEKVGQMTNLTLNTIASEQGDQLVLDAAKMKDVFVDHHIGSIQNVISHAYTLDQWRKMITEIQEYNLANSGHNIPFLYCIDAVHGTSYTIGSTIFPHNIGVGAARNLDLARTSGHITAMETRASGIPYNFSPVLDCGREQQWSRFAETFGEDIYLTTEMGAAVIEGLEGDDVSAPDHVAACMKHFLGYGVPINGLDRGTANISERDLREHFLPSFQRAVEMGTQTLMVNSGDINGVPVHASKALLTDLLRDEMGFKGVVISDWQDILKLHERHKVAATHKEAVRLSVEAGIDLCIVPYDFSFYDDLLALVHEGSISEARIDQSVRRILQMKINLGLFKQPFPQQVAVPNFATTKSKGASLQTAKESITLLKNENLLPLSTAQKVLVTGPTANSLTALNGAWTYTWQGQSSDYFDPTDQTIAQAIQSKWGENAKHMAADGSKALLKAAKSSEVVILCLGEEAYAETPGNIPSIDLPQEQIDLFQQLRAVNENIVVVLLEGRPRIIREIEPQAKAIVLGYWPSSYGSVALADLLAGDYSPSGKLPFTYPRYASERITYDHALLNEAKEVAAPYAYSFEFNPQYEFGHGLSYTEFEYSDLKLASDTITKGETIQASVQVKNVGSVASKLAVELYSRDHYASVVPAVRRLRGFQKISLAAGESQSVAFEIPVERLSFIGLDLKPTLEAGDFDITIGTQTTALHLRE